MKKLIFLIVLLIFLNGCIEVAQPKTENIITQSAKDLLLTKDDIKDYFDGKIMKENVLSKEFYDNFYVKGDFGLPSDVAESIRENLEMKKETYDLKVSDFKEGYEIQYNSPVILGANEYRQMDYIHNSVYVFNNIEGAKRHLKATKAIISTWRKEDVIFSINMGNEGIRINKLDHEIWESQIVFRKANLIFSISYSLAKKIPNSEMVNKTEKLSKIVLEKLD